MPTNLYGEQDNFHLDNSHVIPAMIRKFHDAKISLTPTVTLWGTGRAMREFLHVDDMATACVHVLGLSKERYESVTEPMLSHLNVGSGTDITIHELAETIQQVVGYEGEIIWDTTKPDGTPRKLMDTRKINALGWQPQINLKEGLTNTYRWFVNQHSEFKSQ
jgi:GDP-L-fucose synthase